MLTFDVADLFVVGGLTEAMKFAVAGVMRAVVGHDQHHHVSLSGCREPQSTEHIVDHSGNAILLFFGNDRDRPSRFAAEISKRRGKIGRLMSVSEAMRGLETAEDMRR